MNLQRIDSQESLIKRSQHEDMEIDVHNCRANSDEYFTNRLTWHDVKTDLPFISDTCIDYLVVISGATAPTLLCYDGSNWLDDDGNCYCVTHWMPLPELP